MNSINKFCFIMLLAMISTFTQGAWAICENNLPEYSVPGDAAKNAQDRNNQYESDVKNLTPEELLARAKKIEYNLAKYPPHDDDAGHHQTQYDLCFAKAYQSAADQKSANRPSSTSSVANTNAHPKVTGGCLSVGNNTGMAASAYNRCSFPVNYQYCLVGSSGGPFSCHEQKFGGGNTIPPGGSDGFSTMGAGNHWKVYFAECDASQSKNMPAHLRFTGNKITGTCD